MSSIFNYLKKPEFVLTLGTFICAYGFIFYYLDVALLFKNTTVAGGDTGSHTYIPYYLKSIFPLPKWWSPDWYSGFPFLYFYPPLVYLLTVIVSFLIPLNIAFKLIIASCIFIYPVVFYLTLRFLNFKFPIPQLGVIFSLFLIFLEKYSIYGGNLPSLLAGQFSHTLSIALLFVFLAACYRLVMTGKNPVITTLIGAGVMLSHPTSGLLLIAAAPVLLFQGKNIRESFRYLVFVYLGVFLLTAFFTLGLVWFKPYAGTMEWQKDIKLDELLPPHWYPLIVPAIGGLIFALVKREKALLGVIFTIALSLAAYLTLDNSEIWNNRFLPYILFGILLFAAYGAGTFLKFFFANPKVVLYLTFLIFIPFTFVLVKKNMTFAPSWFVWNFEGYQEKSDWPEAEGLFSYLRSLPQGRVMWEYHPDYEKYGTTRVLETIPVFSGQPTFEGLLIESGLTGPFHFINQTETSEKPTAAIAGFVYPPFDFDKGVEHLKASGASYLVAYSETVKSEADENTDITKLEDVGPFSVYRVNSQLVEVVNDFTIQDRDKDWMDTAIEWYKEGDLESPIIFATEEERAALANISADTANKNIEIMEETKGSLEFKTSDIGKPHLVKISYFPNWKVKGAEGPYLVSPGYMMVIPTEEDVKLYFSYGWVDWIGIGLTFSGVVYLIFNKRILRLSRKLI